MPPGIPALVSPFRALPLRARSAPCSEVVRSQWSALSGARSGRAAKSVRVGCALPSAPCRSPRLGALVRPAASHNAQRRRALALESAGRGGASRDRRRGLEDGGGSTGPSQGGTLPLCRRGRAGALSEGILEERRTRSTGKPVRCKRRSLSDFLSKNKGNKYSCPSYLGCESAFAFDSASKGVRGV